MLATYLRRLEQPVRYALDPVAHQAIHNWIRGNLIGHNLSDAMHSTSIPEDVSEAHHQIQRGQQQHIPNLHQMLQAHAGSFYLAPQQMHALQQLGQDYNHRVNLPGTDFRHQAYANHGWMAEAGNEAGREALSRAPRLTDRVLGLLKSMSATPRMLEMTRAIMPQVHAGDLNHMLTLAHVLQSHRPFPSPATADLHEAVSGNMAMRGHLERQANLEQRQQFGEMPTGSMPEDYYAL